MATTVRGAMPRRRVPGGAGPRPRGARCCDVAPRPELETGAVAQVAEDLQLLGHPVRLQILDILVRRGGEVCVCDLEGAVPVKQPTVSHHLRLLREAGVVETTRRGLWAYYIVRPDVLGALKARVARVLATLA